MKICGFSFIRNAVKYDYPIVESLQSILPLCDKVVVAVGLSEDSTRKLIEGISPKIEIIDTVWDDNLREGGKVLAEETNKALQAISKEFDWCLYIQGDEALHEQDYAEIKSEMAKWKDDEKVDGLLFNYNHFYGSYDYIATSGRWYNHEIRIIKNNSEIYSYGDAMGFRKKDNLKLNVKPLKATVYHYGWVKHPEHQQSKQKYFHKLWTKDAEIGKKVNSAVNQFDYSMIDKLAKFGGSHPKVMRNRISSKNWDFEFDLSSDRRSIKEKVRAYVKNITGWRPGEYKNYNKI